MTREPSFYSHPTQNESVRAIEQVDPLQRISRLLESMMHLTMQVLHSWLAFGVHLDRHNLTSPAPDNTNIQ